VLHRAGSQPKQARTGAARAAPAELSDFEKAFGSVTADVDDGAAHGGSGQGGDRLAALADDEEWRSIRSRATVLAEQVRVNVRPVFCQTHSPRSGARFVHAQQFSLSRCVSMSPFILSDIRLCHHACSGSHSRMSDMFQLYCF
jgi:hypothetical protein